MHEAMKQLVQAGVLRPFDQSLALGLSRLAGETDERVQLAVALASWAVGEGHVCADLERLREEGFVANDEQWLRVPLPQHEAWLQALLASPLVASSFAESRPLVVDGQGRVYLHRYARYQSHVAKAIRSRAAEEKGVAEQEKGAESTQLERILDELFDGFHPQQRQAAVCATRHRFCLISGGPGTGKTTTAVRVLATLQRLAMAEGPALRMAMVAPTGKAAQRLGESVTKQLPTLRCDEDVRAQLPTAASTIHRLLGYRPDRPETFRMGRNKRLPVDVLLVDEVSMVDLVLMAKLFAALEDQARVIFLGDKDQLASVHLGAVVGDIYEASQEGPLRACVVQLTQSHRYAATSGVGQLAEAIHRGDAVAATALCAAELPLDDDGVALHDFHADPRKNEAFFEAALRGYANLWKAADPGQRLKVLDGFRVLCVNRQGPLGVQQLNLEVASFLARKLDLAGGSSFKDGRPIMVRQNDYRLRLFNGDIGVCCRDKDGTFGVYFRTAEGLRRVPLAQLPRHETVFAMTVHKSQGSEVDRVALILPRPESPLASRELIYTAVTRARRGVRLFGKAEALEAAVNRRIQRSSGLVEMLQEA